MNSKSNLFYENFKHFSNEQKFAILKEFLEMPDINDNDKLIDLKVQLIKKFHHYNIPQTDETDEVIEETTLWLKDYTSASITYNNALKKLRNNIFGRNTLDDLRLCLELFLKQYLGNEKSIENQKREIGISLKDKTISTEIRNMFSVLLDYYAKYHNNNVKHDEKYNSNEIYFIFELTTVFLRFLIKLKKIKQ